MANTLLCLGIQSQASLKGDCVLQPRNSPPAGPPTACSSRSCACPLPILKHTRTIMYIVTFLSFNTCQECRSATMKLQRVKSLLTVYVICCVALISLRRYSFVWCVHLHCFGFSFSSAVFMIRRVNQAWLFQSFVICWRCS